MDYQDIDKVFQLAENFYNQYDQFNNMVKEVETSKCRGV